MNPWMDWQDRYLSRETPWDLRRITPPLEHLLRSGRLADWGVPEGARVLVPGCGRGHDLRAWRRAGFQVVGIDIVPEAVREARALLRLNGFEDGVEVLCRDVLGLGESDEHSAAYDLVFDYTCLCALQPHLRGLYAAALARMVRPGGLWLGLVFPLAPAGYGERPPFRLTPADVEAVFGRWFEAVTDVDAVGSVLERQGHERWFVRRRFGVGESRSAPG